MFTKKEALKEIELFDSHYLLRSNLSDKEPECLCGKSEAHSTLHLKTLPIWHVSREKALEQLPVVRHFQV